MGPHFAALVSLALVGCPKAAPEAAVGGDGLPQLEADLPFDSELRAGVLENGFTYFIEHNDEPEDRAAPRFDPGAFEVEKQTRTEVLRNRLLSPGAVFSDARGEALWPTDPLRIVFVGAIPDDFERIVTTWIATLPGGDRAETPKDRGHRMASGPITVEKRVGKEPQAQVRLMWHGPFEDPSYLTRNRYNALDSVISERLREELSEEKSGVYGVSVSSSVQRLPLDRYQFMVSFTCDPERADELAAEVLKVVAELETAPVVARYVEQVTAQRRRSHEENLRSNSYWRNTLHGALQRGEDPVDAVVGYPERIESLTADDIQAAAWKYLSTDNFVKGLRLPEGGD